MKINYKGLMAISIFGHCMLSGCYDEPIDPLNGKLDPLGSEDGRLMMAGNGDVIPGKYIIIFNDTVLPDITRLPQYEMRNEKSKEKAISILKRNNLPNIIPERVYHTAIKGFAAPLTFIQKTELEKDPAVKFIEQDKYIIIGKSGGETSTQPVQTIPYGILRVGRNDGSNKKAWIIDTGIDLDHPDLNVDVAKSKSFLLSGKNFRSPEDEHGHGTHVAGTVAAIDNAIGVVGVASNASVVAVRVLDQNGSGTYSGVIQGVDYVATVATPGHAANMSLGGSPSSSLDLAVKNASDKGIYFALAAGNSSTYAGNFSPARVNGTYVFTVSAMDKNDNWASFSNYGNPPVDYCEPGVSVLSLWKKGGYRTISGTSMAAPHLTGILLITNGRPAINGYVKNDPDGNPDPVGHL